MLSNDEGDLPNGAVINISGDYTTPTMVAPVHLKNISTDTIDVLAKKIELEKVTGSVNTFCWAGSCYPPDVYVSTESVSLAPDEKTTEFEGLYQPNENYGITTIMYVWFDENNTKDSVYVIVNYNTNDVKKLSITGPDGHIADGSTITVKGGLDEITAEGIKVLNFQDETVEVKVKKFISAGDTIAGTENYFWWDKQYDPDTYESDLLTIGGLKTNYDFKGVYDPNDNEGTSTIRYEFYDVEDDENKAFINIEYVAEPSIVDKNIHFGRVSHAYPNPSGNQVNFDYDLSDRVISASIIINNLLGSKIKEIEIVEESGTLTINTGNFPEGLYLYSVVINGKIEVTRKLVVRR